MNIAIVGYDTEGRASYDYFSQDPTNQITICDQKTELEPPPGVASQLGENYLDNLGRFDLVLRTPGLHPRKILDKNPGIEAKISSHINEFLKACPTLNVIGVTGTKGKGTTSSLITKMLEADGKTVRLGGNIGVPPLSFIQELDAGSWVVLELSSFQLIDLKHSPHIAVCLMVASEHLDWHADLEEYLTAKEQLFARQATGDVAIYFYGNQYSERIAAPGQAQKVSYYHSPGAEVVDGAIVIDGHEICKTSELKLLGQHNWQNACAAVTAVWYSALEVCGPSDLPNITAMREVLTYFSGLEHRLELVRELNGVAYYNDSFGTTPETAIVAIQAFDQPKVLILGGSDKGADYTQLARAVKNGNVRQVLLIGEQAGRIRESLTAAGYGDVVPGGITMPEIVANAQAAAQSGDVVLLSTACASLDMFKNYKDRGEQYKQAVLSL